MRRGIAAMRPTRALFAAATAIALAAAIAVALPFYDLNPVGTDALANGKLILQASGGRAPLNLQLFPSAPGGAADNDFFIVHSGGTHQLCFRAASTNFCANAISTP
jgi:hypothetical protein